MQDFHQKAQVNRTLDAIKTLHVKQIILHQNLWVNNGILPRRRGDMEVTRRGFVKFDINQGVNIEFDKTGCIWRKTGDLIIVYSVGSQ